MKSRIQSVDALRGLVMIIMALDHVRDFFHSDARFYLPEDLTRTTAALFFTRWITHICAPVFMFTAGLGACLWLARGRTIPELSRFLWTRGVWLVVLEFTVLRLAMNFTFFRGIVFLSVLWALGCSMIALALLVRLPRRTLACISIAAIALHNLSDSLDPAQFGGAAWIWNVLHRPGVFRLGGVPAHPAYPLIPWIFVMSAGFCFGELFTLDPPRRRRWMTRIGVALVIAFLVLRGLNLYGDPVRWSTQPPGMTVLSFLRCTKYPPSLDFLLMTLGPAILILSWLDRQTFARTNPLIVFGRTPLFYFLGHFFLAHALAVLVALIRHGRAGFILDIIPSMGGPAPVFPQDYGLSLPGVYAVWIAVVVIMYPLCLWFARLKERRRDWWLSYL